jgi:nucleotide-binding universal stress UspA family protein
MKILIGVDDSPHAEAAVEYVRSATWPKDTKVIVVSAVMPQVGVYSEVYVPAPVELERVLEDRIAHAQGLVSNIESRLRDRGLTTEARVLTGDPRETLLETATRERVDLIVVGSHGRSGIAKLLLGSVASHIVTHSPCSVMVVKKPPR